MATIELYTTGLHAEKNFVIDNITGFLNSANVTKVYTFLNYQYIRPEYEINIKIDADQNLLNRTKNPDYLAVSEDNFVWYYYVNSVSQVAQKTLRFYCTMDVLNTYNGRYKLTKNSLIERQHVDRWKKLSSQDYTDRTEINVAPIKSRTVEGLTPALYKTQDKILSQGGLESNYRWYLVYWKTLAVSESLIKPVIGLCADQDIVYRPGENPQPADVYYSYNDVPTSWQYQTEGIISWVDQYGLKDSYDLTTNNCYALTYRVPANYVFGGGYYKCILGIFKIEDGTEIKDVFIGENGVIDGKSAILKRSGAHKTYYSQELITNYDLIIRLPYINNEKGGTASVIKSINNINNTDENIQKIIECPYAPCTMSVDSDGRLIAPPGWFYLDKDKDGKQINQLVNDNLAPDFYTHIETSIKVDPFRHNYIIAKSTLSSPLGPLVDVKTYNTDCYKRNFVYDNESYTLPYETVTNNTGSDNASVGFSYIQSNNVSSDLMFMFDYSDERITQLDDDSFDNLILSNRNNELPVFNSAYLTYMNNGYNYDKKLQRIQATSDLIGVAEQTIQGGMSGGVAGAAIGLAKGSVSFGLSHLSRETQMAAKINSTKLAGFSVSGVNNLSLFRVYSGNLLHYMVFEPDEPTKEMINKYYSLYGYNQGYYLVPDTNSRYAFNYVRGDVDVDGDDFKQPYFDAKDMIAEKYRGGVYFIHNRAATPDFWDLDLATTNWEISVLPSSWI